MEIMCFIFSFIPATIWLTIGYLVLYLAARSEGSIKRFGKILAIWIFIIAALIPIIGAYITLSGCCPLDMILDLLKGSPSN
jgi:hypothetical protein